MPSSQRPFFLSSFFAAFRQPSTGASPLAPAPSQQHANKHTAAGPVQGPAGPPSDIAAAVASARTQHASAGNEAAPAPTASLTPVSSPSPPPAAARAIAAGRRPYHSHSHAHTHTHAHAHTHNHRQLPSSSTSPAATPDYAGPSGRRRGSDSSSEGFREVLGADKWYVGGRTAAGDERFFKLGVVRRIRSGDRLSLDRLSL